ncbi:MAG TPA: carboxylesterase family protein [Opitutaceae bacterium]|nr:carboxylesterase family protein [Opitutaceae bacterium]
MNINRRSFIQTFGSIAAGLGLSPALRAAADTKSAPEADDGPALQIGDQIAVADTKYGMVRGFILNGITVFRGIPYGADTSGANRFMPPKEPAPWNGVKPALWWGNSAPQDMTNRFANPYQSFVDHWNYDELSEDCLRLNVWTPALSDGGKRPVMVWLHGGGFTNGNGIEQDGYDGENFARLGNVVFCSINHRLGPIGFTDLSSIGGEKYAQSGNVGMLDIVAALQWVRDNIESFGGDPNNVTVSGQSGGGAKVTLLTAMPSAKGLFHKGVALSGSTLHGAKKEKAAKLAAHVLTEAGLTAADLDKLQQMPWKDYIQIAARASKNLSAEQGNKGRGMEFGPVADGVVVPEGTFYSDPAGLGSDIPLIVSTMLNEQSPSRFDSAMESISLAGVKTKVRDHFGDKTDEVVDAYAKAFPKAKPVEIWSLVSSNRQGAIATADAKAAQKAPVYVSWFAWQPSLFDNRQRAFHCLDISFWFYNTDRMLTHTGGGAKARRLGTAMSKTLVQFMRTGNPNSGDLPEWPTYTPSKGETMVFNDVSAVQDDPDREARKSLPART